MLMGQTYVACISLSLALSLSKIIIWERFLDISASSTHVDDSRSIATIMGQTCVGLFLALSKIFIWVRNRAQMPSSVSRTCWGADHSLLSPVPPPLPFLSPFGAFYVASLCLVPSRLVFLTTHLPSTFVPVRVMFFHLFLGPPPFDSFL